jgi:hypothetical protein
MGNKKSWPLPYSSRLMTSFTILLFYTSYTWGWLLYMSLSNLPHHVMKIWHFDNLWTTSYMNAQRGPLHTRPRAREHYTSSTLIGGKGRARPSSLQTTLEGPTKHVNARCMDAKSTWIPIWHRMDHVFMVTWIISKNHFLEIGLTHNRETMSLQMLTIVDIL